MTIMEIWQPRYKDKMVLLAKYKVDTADEVIEIFFSKAKHLEGKRFTIRRDEVKKYPIDSNGKIDCYVVPFRVLQGVPVLKVC